MSPRNVVSKILSLIQNIKNMPKYTASMQDIRNQTQRLLVKNSIIEIRIMSKAPIRTIMLAQVQ